MSRTVPVWISLLVAIFAQSCGSTEVPWDLKKDKKTNETQASTQDQTPVENERPSPNSPPTTYSDMNKGPEVVIRSIKLGEDEDGLSALIIEAYQGMNSCDASKYEVDISVEADLMTASRKKNPDRASRICPFIYEPKFTKVTMNINRETNLQSLKVIHYKKLDAVEPLASMLTNSN